MTRPRMKAGLRNSTGQSSEKTSGVKNANRRLGHPSLFVSIKDAGENHESNIWVILVRTRDCCPELDTKTVQPTDIVRTDCKPPEWFVTSTHKVEVERLFVIVLREIPVEGLGF